MAETVERPRFHGALASSVDAVSTAERGQIGLVGRVGRPVGEVDEPFESNARLAGGLPRDREIPAAEG